MAMMPLPLQDDATSISTSNHSSSKSTSANATAGSGVQNSSSSDSTHKRSRSKHISKSSKHESSEKSCDQVPHLHKESIKISKDVNNVPADNAIPFLTINHHRILKWMETGQEELQKQKVSKARHPSKSRQLSSSRAGESYTGHHQPNQPIAQDPMMPLLPQPEATTVLGEVRRRLMETKEQDKKSKHNQKHRLVQLRLLGAFICSFIHCNDQILNLSQDLKFFLRFFSL
jgi:axin 1